MSGAIGADGCAWLWGFGTNGQLGNGNDDSDKEVPSLLKGKALQGKRVVQVYIASSPHFHYTWSQNIVGSSCTRSPAVSPHVPLFTVLLYAGQSSAQ